MNVPVVKLVAVVAAVGLGCAGCNAPSPRLNAPPHGSAENVSHLQGMYVYMTDNALLADMTVCDMHFLPHRPLLNELGRERLARLASLIEAYGGQVRFDTDCPDEALVTARLNAVGDFLRDAGLDTGRALVVRDMAGGTGAPADQAILIKANEGSYRPKKGESAAYGGATPAKGTNTK